VTTKEDFMLLVDTAQRSAVVGELVEILSKLQQKQPTYQMFQELANRARSVRDGGPLRFFPFDELMREEPPHDQG